MQLLSNQVAKSCGRSMEIAVMKQVAVYLSERRSNALRKECLIYQSINLALGSMPDVALQHHPMPICEAGKSRPGLKEVQPHEKIVALGRAAHTVLADYRKRTLVARSEYEDELEEDLERLVWSCVNTSKVVALGRSAWRSVQMLPISDRRFYDIPPLRMAHAREDKPADEIGVEVLVINHEDDDGRARQVGDALTRGQYRVQTTGRGCENDGGLDSSCWSATAAIHVHVGCHDSGADEVRLLDSWHSRRFVILLLPRRLAKEPPPGSLMVDPEVNGFLCDTTEQVLAACADIRGDAILRKKMLYAGEVGVAPMAREWLNIAKELVI